MKPKYFINQSMRAELDNFRYILSSSSDINWEIPIRYIIHSDYECTVSRDACLSGGHSVMSSDFSIT